MPPLDFHGKGQVVFDGSIRSTDISAFVFPKRLRGGDLQGHRDRTRFLCAAKTGFLQTRSHPATICGDKTFLDFIRKTVFHVPSSAEGRSSVKGAARNQNNHYILSRVSLKQFWLGGARGVIS